MTIKPCPFCGETPKLEFKSGDYGYTYNSASIRCHGCRIGFYRDTEKWERGRGVYCVKDEAVKYLTEKWNTRFDSG